VSGWPAGGLPPDQTGGGSLNGSGAVVADGDVVDGDADGNVLWGLMPGSLVGNPVLGFTGDVPNGGGVTEVDGVPAGDCGASVDGDEDAGGVGCGTAPVWASTRLAVASTATSARTIRIISVIALPPRRPMNAARTVPGSRRWRVGITAGG
jgi:hypothetical protein